MLLELVTSWRYDSIMVECQTVSFLSSRNFEEWKKDYGKILTEIQNPISLESISDSIPCPCCNRPVCKTYLDWEIPGDFDDREKLIVIVSNTAGYKCAGDCDMTWPSNIGLLQTIDQALPVFQERGLEKTVKALQWTKQILLEVILPS